jgi:serine/threonine protein kinase
MKPCDWSTTPSQLIRCFWMTTGQSRVLVSGTPKREDDFDPSLDHYLDAGKETFWYAPEIISHKHCGCRLDIWSVGCLTTELCSGIRPKSRSSGLTTKSASEQAQNVLRLLESGEVLETPFSALVCTMIHEDAEQRFHTGQLLKLLEKKSAMLDARRTKIKEMTTSPSRMVGMDTLYASSCLRPLLRDHMVLLRLLGFER